MKSIFKCSPAGCGPRTNTSMPRHGSQLFFYQLICRGPAITRRSIESVIATMKPAIAAALLAACTPHTPPRATAADAERAQVEIVQLEQGRELLIKKCEGCHKTPMPTDHTAADWPTLLDEMAERSKLDRVQRSLIEKYLVVMAERDVARR